MNNFDKIIQQKLRSKCFRAPKIEEIKIRLESSWVGETLAIYIGKDYRRNIPINRLEKFALKSGKLKLRIELIERIVDYFNKHKEEKWLKKLCKLVNIKYDKLFEPKIRSYLLTKEGINFAKLLLYKLMNRRKELLGVTKKLNEMKPEISVFDNHSKRIYKKRSNNLLYDLKWTIKKLVEILKFNGVTYN